MVIKISQNPKQRPADLCEFKANLLYKASSKTARTVTQKNSKKKRKEIKVGYDGKQKLVDLHEFEASLV